MSHAGKGFSLNEGVYSFPKSNSQVYNFAYNCISQYYIMGKITTTIIILWPKLQPLPKFLDFFKHFLFLGNCFFLLLKFFNYLATTFFTSFGFFSIFSPVNCFFFSFFFALAIFILSGHHCLCLLISLWGGSWPKYYGFQSAIGAFRVSFGLNITTSNPH